MPAMPKITHCRLHRYNSRDDARPANLMKLKDLLQALPCVHAASDASFAVPELAGISADSRRIKPGDLFVAVTGASDDGLHFVDQALASGAVAVMAERAPPRPLPYGTAFIKVSNVRRALALAAARFFPRAPGVVAAVTGTSGKTSVAAFARQIWSELGIKAASIGTVGLVSPQRAVYGSLTTPDPVALHRSLDELAGEGVTHLAIEASSHGLDQHVSTAYAWRRAPSPISAAIISTTIRRSKPILPPSCGYSPI